MNKKNAVDTIQRNTRKSVQETPILKNTEVSIYLQTTQTMKNNVSYASVKI